MVAHYTNAKDVLPGHLLKEVQRHVQGALLYVPSPNERKPWGAVSGTRGELARRNEQIKQDYRDGNTVDQLAQRYYLSCETIKRLIQDR